MAFGGNWAVGKGGHHGPWHDSSTDSCLCIGDCEHRVPATALTLGTPATSAEIDEVQTAIGLQLPAEFCESLRRHNGQNDPTRCHSFCGEGLFASTKQIIETWRMVTDLDQGFRQ